MLKKDRPRPTASRSSAAAAAADEIECDGDGEVLGEVREGGWDGDAEELAEAAFRFTACCSSVGVWIGITATVATRPRRRCASLRCQRCSRRALAVSAILQPAQLVLARRSQ